MNPYSYLSVDNSLLMLKPDPEQITTTYKGKDRRHIFDGVQYTSKEINLIEQFRKVILPLVGNYYYDDATLLRYLYSGNLEMQSSYQKFQMYHQWMTNNQIQTLSESSIKILKDGAIYTYGRDRKYRPIVIMDLSVIEFDKYPIDAYFSAMNAVLNIVIKNMFIKGVVQKYLFIIDVAGKGFTSLPFDGLKTIIKKLGTVYSLRLGTMLLLNTNFLIQLSYRAISNFLSEETTKRITLLSTSEMNKIQQIVQPQQLQAKYGGTNPNLNCHWPPRVPHIHRGSKIHKNIRRQDSITQFYSVISDNQIFKENIQNQVYCCSNENSYCVIY